MGRIAGHRRGKLLGLISNVLDHAEALEYDLLTLGLDIRDLWRGEMSWRRLRVVVEHLPGDSAFLTALSGDERTRVWGLQEHLLALLFDALQQNTVMSIAPYVKKAPKMPDPLPRPGVEKKRTVRVMKLSEMPGAFTVGE